MKRVFALLLLSAALFSCSKKEEHTDPPMGIISEGRMQFSDITSESVRISITGNKPFNEIWPVIYYRESLAADTTIYTRFELPDSIYTMKNLKPATDYVFKLEILDYDVFMRVQWSVITTIQ